MLLPGVCTNPDLRCDYNVQQLFNRSKLFKPKQSSPPNTTGTENGVEQVFNLTNTNTLLGTIKIAASYKEVMNSVFLFDSWVFQFQISKRTKNLRGGISRTSFRDIYQTSREIDNPSVERQPRVEHVGPLSQLLFLKSPKACTFFLWPETDPWTLGSY